MRLKSALAVISVAMMVALMVNFFFQVSEWEARDSGGHVNT